MIQVIYLTQQDIITAIKKLNNIDCLFKTQGEKDAISDFACCLKTRLSKGTAYDFLVNCEEAARDLTEPTKVPEVYGKDTIGFIHATIPFIAEEIFGKSFSEEVKQFMGVYEPV